MYANRVCRADKEDLAHNAREYMRALDQMDAEGDPMPADHVVPFFVNATVDEAIRVAGGRIDRFMLESLAAEARRAVVAAMEDR